MTSQAKNHNQKTRQCSRLKNTGHAIQPFHDVIASQNIPADSIKVNNQDDFHTQVVEAPQQASHERQSTSRQNTEMLHDNAGAASQCKSGSGSHIKLKVPVTLTRSASEHKGWGINGRNNLLQLSDDKCSLAIHNKTQKQELLWQAKDKTTSKKWQSQNKDKFGFIPLGDLVSLANNSLDSPVSIHKRLRASQVPIVLRLPN